MAHPVLEQIGGNKPKPPTLSGSMNTPSFAIPRLSLLHLDRGRVSRPRRARLTPETMPMIAIGRSDWDSPRQWTQRFLSMHAATHPLLYVETHRSESNESHVQLRILAENRAITVLRLQLPSARWDEPDFIKYERRRLLRELLHTPVGLSFQRPILWIQDPAAAAAFAGQLGESMIVLDCMDDRSTAQGASEDLLEDQIQLARSADLVICSDETAKRKYLPHHPNSIILGPGVDCDHFATAMDEDTPLDPEIAEMRGPILGYIGEIDERIDFELVAQLADADPNWNIVMVGPLSKAVIPNLPARPNLHWLGARSDEALPSLIKGLDTCIMPYIRGATPDLARVLECMAAGRPVISTLTSSLRLATHIAEDPESFIAHCMQQSQAPSPSHLRIGLRLAADHGWENVLSKANGHLQEILDAQQAEIRESMKLHRAPLGHATAAAS